jgi:MFS family permease
MLPDGPEPRLTQTRAFGRVLAGFPALRHRNFRLFVVGQGISLIGFWMQSVALGWLIVNRLGGSPLDVGLVAFAGYLPILCLSPLAGVIADRLPRHALLVLSQTLLMLLAFGLGTLVVLDGATIGRVILFAAGVGLVSALDVPTRQSFLVQMVGPEDLPNAIALNSSIFNGARVVGPAIAGSLVAASGEAPCFFLNGASYVAVITALLAMRLPRRAPVPAQPLASGFVSGVRYVWATPVLRNLLILLGIVCALAVQYAVLMPTFAKSVFHAGPGGFGLLLTAGGIGAMTSSLQLAARRYTRLEHRRHLVLGLVLFGGSVLGLAVSPRLEVALVCQTLAGYGMVRYLATTNTLLQLYVDDAYRGRMMGLHTVMFLGTQPLGSLVLGALANRFGAPRAAIVSGSVALAAAAWLAFRLRRLAERERRARRSAA